MSNESTSEEKIREVVRDGYARVATRGKPSCCGGAGRRT